ncbi:MAG: hypothetical protein ACK4M7_11090, partial [Burkholderiales bacterium]
KYFLDHILKRNSSYEETDFFIDKLANNNLVTALQNPGYLSKFSTSNIKIFLSQHFDKYQVKALKYCFYQAGIETGNDSNKLDIPRSSLPMLLAFNTKQAVKVFYRYYAIIENLRKQKFELLSKGEDPYGIYFSGKRLFTHCETNWFEPTEILDKHICHISLKPAIKAQLKYELRDKYISELENVTIKESQFEQKDAPPPLSYPMINRSAFNFHDFITQHLFNHYKWQENSKHSSLSLSPIDSTAMQKTFRYIINHFATEQHAESARLLCTKSHSKGSYIEIYKNSAAMVPPLNQAEFSYLKSYYCYHKIAKFPSLQKQLIPQTIEDYKLNEFYRTIVF